MSTPPPAQGARFELARDRIDVEGAVYAIAVIATDARYAAEARVSTARVETTWRSEPPAWIAETAHGFLKTLQKNHAADGSWPARWVRWRSERG